MLVPRKDRISFFFAGTAIRRLLAAFSLERLRKLSEFLEPIPFVFGKLPALDTHLGKTFLTLFKGMVLAEDTHLHHWTEYLAS